MNAFELLGLETRLTIGPQELQDAFREVGKTVHPDAGGTEDGFAMLRQAQAILASPSRRLRHWLELSGHAVQSRGAVDAQVMDLFTAVGAVSQRAEMLVRRRDEAKTSLGRALLEGETQQCREQVEAMLATIESAITGQCDHFSAFEQAAAVDPEAISAAVRNLAFLEKWRDSLRSLYARLV